MIDHELGEALSAALKMMPRMKGHISAALPPTVVKEYAQTRARLHQALRANFKPELTMQHARACLSAVSDVKAEAERIYPASEFIHSLGNAMQAMTQAIESPAGMRIIPDSSESIIADPSAFISSVKAAPSASISSVKAAPSASISSVKDTALSEEIRTAFNSIGKFPSSKYPSISYATKTSYRVLRDGLNKDLNSNAPTKTLIPRAENYAAALDALANEASPGSTDRLLTNLTTAATAIRAAVASHNKRISAAPGMSSSSPAGASSSHSSMPLTPPPGAPFDQSPTQPDYGRPWDWNDTVAPTQPTLGPPPGWNYGVVPTQPTLEPPPSWNYGVAPTQPTLGPPPGWNYGVVPTQPPLEPPPSYEFVLTQPTLGPPRGWDYRSPKRESTPMRPSGLAPEPDYIVEPVGTAQKRYIPVQRGFVWGLEERRDGTVEIIASEALNLEDRDQAMYVSGSQEYDSDLNRVFPIRDPANPHLVHPDYVSSGAQDRCSRTVQILDTKLTQATLDQLWAAYCTVQPPPPGTSARVRAAEKRKFHEQIKHVCRAELESTLTNKAPPSQDYLEVIRVEEIHCNGPDEAALVGQFGLSLSPRGWEKQPTLANGRILCLFAGAKLSTVRDEESYIDTYGTPGEHWIGNYGADVRARGSRRLITYAPYGGGNFAQYANSAFKAVGNSLIVDQSACNASLHPVTFELLNNRGQQVNETMLFCALRRQLNPNEQVRLDYGPNFRLNRSNSQTGQRPVVRPSEVKPEPAERSLRELSPWTPHRHSLLPPTLGIPQHRDQPGSEQTRRARTPPSPDNEFERPPRKKRPYYRGGYKRQ